MGKADKFIKGHIPEAKYARDFDRYSTQHIRLFLGLPQEGSPTTRTLRLIAMKRLWPIYDLDGEQFWTAFWQCVACMLFMCSLQTSTNSHPPGHYQLWVNGIHHCDISLKNLMYDIPSETGVPVGVVNDFDLASWDNHPTKNNDRTGTIPFMAIDLLDGGLETHIVRPTRPLDTDTFIVGGLQRVTHSYPLYTSGISGTDE